jgi:hypothetical protein
MAQNHPQRKYAWLLPPAIDDAAISLNMGLCRLAVRCTVMSDYRHGYVRFQNREYKVTWHPISKEVYVYWGTDKYTGKAYDMQGALDLALSWLNNHAR